MQEIEILSKLSEIISQGDRPHLTFKEACKYLDLSPSYLYKLTSSGKVPCFKPNGKKLIFTKQQLDTWLTAKPVKTSADIEQEAIDHVTLGKNRAEVRS
ncbi:MAG: helix-turn-helix domain-containing protein [Alphaproteobacteria bacterium]|nr:helix-turn-helix domain-containing protein [Alphaproteobacteria bacterium]